MSDRWGSAPSGANPALSQVCTSLRSAGEALGQLESVVETVTRRVVEECLRSRLDGFEACRGRLDGFEAQLQELRRSRKADDEALEDRLERERTERSQAFRELETLLGRHASKASDEGHRLESRLAEIEKQRDRLAEQEQQRAASAELLHHETAERLQAVQTRCDGRLDAFERWRERAASVLKDQQEQGGQVADRVDQLRRELEQLQHLREPVQQLRHLPEALEQLRRDLEASLGTSQQSCEAAVQEARQAAEQHAKQLLQRVKKDLSGQLQQELAKAKEATDRAAATGAGAASAVSALRGEWVERCDAVDQAHGDMREELRRLQQQLVGKSTHEDVAQALDASQRGLAAMSDVIGEELKRLRGGPGAGGAAALFPRSASSQGERRERLGERPSSAGFLRVAAASEPREFP